MLHFWLLFVGGVFFFLLACLYIICTVDKICKNNELFVLYYKCLIHCGFIFIRLSQTWQSFFYFNKIITMNRQWAKWEHADRSHFLAHALNMQFSLWVGTFSHPAWGERTSRTKEKNGGGEVESVITCREVMIDHFHLLSWAIWDVWTVRRMEVKLSNIRVGLHEIWIQAICFAMYDLDVLLLVLYVFLKFGPVVQNKLNCELTIKLYLIVSYRINLLAFSF